MLGRKKSFPKPQLVHFAELCSKNVALCLMWRAEVGTSAEGFKVNPGPWPAPAPASPGSLQFPPAALPGCCQAPSDRLLATPLLAGAATGLALYEQTPDQPHGDSFY